METTQDVVHIDKLSAPNLMGIIAQALDQHISTLVEVRVAKLIDKYLSSKREDIESEVRDYLSNNFSLSDYVDLGDEVAREVDNWMSNNFDIGDHFDIDDYADEIGEIASRNLDGDKVLEALSGCQHTVTISL